MVRDTQITYNGDATAFMADTDAKAKFAASIVAAFAAQTPPVYVTVSAADISAVAGVALGAGERRLAAREGEEEREGSNGDEEEKEGEEGPGKEDGEQAALLATMALHLSEAQIFKVTQRPTSDTQRPLPTPSAPSNTQRPTPSTQHFTSNLPNT